MAAITSAQSGLWSATATWVGGVVPGDGDTVTIAAGHTVTIAAGSPVTIGAAGATGTVALTLANAASALVVNADLTLKGDLLQGRDGTSVTVAAGVRVRLQAAAATTYKWTTPDNAVSGWATIDLNGTPGSRVTLDAAGGGVGFLDWNAGAPVRVFPDSVTCELLGSTGGQEGLRIALTTNDAQLVGIGLLVKNCGFVRIAADAGACTAALDQLNICAPVDSHSLILQGTVDKTGGLRQITRLVLYSSSAKQANLNGRDWVIEGVSVNHMVSASSSLRQTFRMFHVATVALEFGAPTGQHIIYPDTQALIEQSAYVGDVTDHHAIAEGVPAGAALVNTIQDSVFDFDGQSGLFNFASYLPGQNSIPTVRRNIFLNKAGHLTEDASGTRLTILHNTFYDAYWLRPQAAFQDAAHLVAVRGNLFVNQGKGLRQSTNYLRATTFDADYNGYAQQTQALNLVHPVHGTPSYLAFPDVAQVASVTTTAGTTTTVVVAAAATFVTSGVQAGDYWFNATRTLGARIQSVDSETQLTLFEAVTGQVSGDAGAVRKSYWSTAGKKYGDDNAGQHDVSAAPLFPIPTRTTRTWDTRNGGPGTLANVIAEIVKLNGWDTAGVAAAFNPAYTLADYLAYIRAGFRPRASALRAAGDPTDGSLDLGALPVGGSPHLDSDLIGRSRLIGGRLLA